MKWGLSIILLSFFLEATGQSTSIENGWVKIDSVFISNLKNAYKANPLNVEQLLSYKGNRREKLGFDYYCVSGSTGKGYVSIFYEFIYYKDILVSYRLQPQMPRDKRLTKTYKKLYDSLVKISDDQRAEPIYYGFKDVAQPLVGHTTKVNIDQSIAFFMTPYSGILYGYYRGFGDDLIDNRRNYLLIKNQITPEVCELLMYSKNPATRLSAIEFYYKNRNLFIHHKKRLENRIAIIFNELPIISTTKADMKITENARDLVNNFVKKY